MKRDWEEQYRKLKERDPDLFRKAIEYGEGVSITHDLGPKAAADVEVALVCLALELTEERKQP